MDKIVSSGYKFDLHIHSCFSKNKDKDRVQNNTAANIQVLLNKLEENQVNICAITDHDVFNYEIYRKLKANEGQGELKKVLPGVEFSVSFKQEGTEKVVHVVTIFDDIDDIKVKNIEKVLGKQTYDGGGAFSEESYFRILREIDLDTIMIAHQKNTLTTKAKAKKDDALALGEKKFNEFLFLNYFQAYEFRNKKNQLYNKTYITEKGLDGNLRMLTGSDCHDWNCYPDIDQNDHGGDFAFSYCKCLPSFKGLMMAVTDSRRIKLENSFFNPNAKVEEIITIEVDQKRIDVPLSKGINVIIGDNSIGKSLLLHALTNYANCNTKLKTGYSKYLKEKKAAVISKIADEKLFKFDMQGQIRSQFEEGAIKGSEFLLSYCPPDIDVREPRNVIEQELDKVYNHLQAKFDYDQKLSDLSFFKLIPVGSESKSLTFVGKIPDKKTEGFKQIVADIKEINQRLERLLKKKELEDGDKQTIENFASALHELETKYDRKVQEINKENSIRNTVSSILIEFKKRYSHHISDEQKIISSFLASKEEVVNEIYELVKKHNESKEPAITIPTLPIQPNESSVYKYNFVSKLNIDSISQDYFASLFKKVFKKNKKLDFGKITSKKLKEYILYYPSEQAHPLDALKQKINELLDADFSPRHSIVVNGMDRFKELSTGFNSQMYFSLLLATENKNPGIYIVDQPEDNISQKSIRDTVLDDIKELGYTRQVIMVTHNPQFIVNLDVDNVIFMTVDEGGNLQLKSGALEYECDDYAILDIIAENVDGGLASIEKRLKRYEKRIQTEAQ